MTQVMQYKTKSVMMVAIIISETVQHIKRYGYMLDTLL